jgi:hypothetical protein
VISIESGVDTSQIRSVLETYCGDRNAHLDRCRVHGSATWFSGTQNVGREVLEQAALFWARVCLPWQARRSDQAVVVRLRRAMSAELIRKMVISAQIFYRWKAMYTGIEVDQVRQLKQLRDENTQLKQLVATGTPTSACFNAPTICSTENFFFMARSSKPVDLVGFKRIGNGAHKAQ